MPNILIVDLYSFMVWITTKTMSQTALGSFMILRSQSLLGQPEAVSKPRPVSTYSIWKWGHDQAHNSSSSRRRGTSFYLSTNNKIKMDSRLHGNDIKWDCFAEPRSDVKGMFFVINKTAEGCASPSLAMTQCYIFFNNIAILSHCEKSRPSGSTWQSVFGFHPPPYGCVGAGPSL